MAVKFKNGKLRIMQVSDPQDFQYVRPTMVRMLNTAYDKYKPDLVVFTGDNILGNHLRDARFYSRFLVKTKVDEKKAIEKSLEYILKPLEKRNIPFAMIYGNHDDRNGLTKEEQADIYKTYPHIIGLDCPDSPDVDTYNIPVYDEKGEKIKFNLWMLDSAWYDKQQDKCFEMVKPEAVEWYREKSKRLTAENGGVPIPAFMFQHIPMAETLRLVEECDQGEKGAVKWKDGKAYRLKNGVKGVMSEYPGVVEGDGSQFDAIKECGDVRAVIFGHDHPNCFEGNVDGIDFIQTSCASFRCYGDRTRGVRVFDIDEKTGAYTTEFHTYRDICGGGVLNEIAYIWDADGMIKQKTALIAGACVGICAVGAGIFALSKR